MAFPLHEVQLVNGAQFVTGTTKHFPLGTKGVTGDGRVYRYIYTDEALDYPLSCAGGAEVQSLDAGAVHGAHAEGATTVTIDGTSDGSPAAGYYDDALIFFYEDEYPTMRIISSSAAASASPYDVTLKLEGGLPCAVSDDCVVYIQPNMYAGAVCCWQGGGDKNLTIRPALGVPAVKMAASSYGWVQTRGPCVCIPAGTVPGTASGDRVCVWGSDGSVSILDEMINNDTSWQIAGYSMAVDGSGTLWVYLTMD
jgi:hypothetical protein